MKGAILSRDPSITIVDVSHDVPRHDIAAAAFLLYAAYRDFPPGTVHVCVVDPGVGSARHPIAFEAAGQRFVGPDNGTFSYVMEREGVEEVRRIEVAELSGPDVSRTFHGRDLFAPAGAILAGSLPIRQIGPEIRRPERLGSIRARSDPDGTVHGRILHVDHFGNCVTNLTPGDVGGDPSRYRYRFAGGLVDSARSYYDEDESRTPFAIEGSAGFVEFAVNRGSAAEVLGLQPGDPVIGESSDR